MQTIRTIAIGFLLFLTTGLRAQTAEIKGITPENLMKLQQYEDTLKFFNNFLYKDSIISLKDGKIDVKERVEEISIVKPDDNAFRIITWQLAMKDHTHRYYGTIQMNNPELKMFPLIDMSPFIRNEQDTLLSANSWYGCLYFNVVKQKYKRNTYYLLFGWDGNDMFSNKKMVDVLTFDKMGAPMFGYPMFLLKDNPDPKTRIIIEYKEDASPAMNYDEKEKMIIISYLRPENPMSEGIYFTYIPDGTYVGFYFKKGMWRFKEKVFDLEMDQAPDFTPKQKGEDPNIYIKE